VAGGTLGVRELARQSGIDRSAVSRLLGQLRAMGMVSADSRQGGYAAGPRLFRLSATMVARDSLNRAARPILEKLAGLFNETCYLAVREADHFTFRSKVDTTRPVRFVVDLGHTAPLHVGAAGRAILAGLGEEERLQTIEALALLPFTESTITNRGELLATAQSDRLRGYSVSTGERAKGATAIAAPFFDAFGTCLGSVVVVQPAERFQETDPEVIGAAVVEAGRELSARLGHVPAGGSDAPAAGPPTIGTGTIPEGLG
jgi:IclR family KDG regulon transcriptional repressor